MDQIASVANKHARRATEVFQTMSAIEYHFDLNAAHNHYNRLKKSEKLKKQNDKQKKDEIREFREKKVIVASQ